MSCQHLNPSNYTNSLQGKFIYKDQCTRCFSEATDEQGIDLCLKCFNGGCLANDFQHSQQHFQFAQHPLVLNVRQVPKKQDEEGQQNQEITKLAIGKEGGAQLDKQAQYDTIYQLKCIPCNKTLDNSNLQGLIDSVAKAENSLLKANIVAWELEIQPCEHTLTIQQVQPFQIENNRLAHCGDCELSSNLWLCLYCGYLGCGRKYFDGSGGNNHAIDHFKSANHPLVVKLGTITPEGQASIHCYACDEEVQDNYLAEHLRNFGILVEKQVKTEKTMAELELQANLNLELSKAMEEGRVLEQVFGAGRTGLSNLGNSCYINSVVQVLLSLDEFKQRYFDEGKDHLQTCKNFSPSCFECQLSKLAMGLSSGLYSNKITRKVYDHDLQKELEEHYQKGLKLHMFKELVGKDHPEFKTSKQQDALEYLNHVFDFIKKSSKQKGLEDITQVFTLENSTKVKCLTCNSFKLQKNKGQELRLNCPYVKDQADYPVSFMDLVNDFASGSFVQDANCEKCNKKTNQQLNYYLSHFPKYLMVAINRFVMDNWVPQKVNAYINFPEDIDLSKLVLPPIGANEQQIEEQKKDPALEVNQGHLADLINMGFSKNRCVRALKAQNDNLENALNWLFANAEDPSLDLPLEQENSGNNQGAQVPQELVEMIEQMGFSSKMAKFALSKCDNNVERAIEYLFNHPDELENMELEGQQQQQQQPQGEKQNNLNPKYKLHACIVHLGKSVGSGHYVCYIRKDNEWIYYNDEKVSRTPEPLLGKGYIYILKQVE